MRIREMMDYLGMLALAMVFALLPCQARASNGNTTCTICSNTGSVTFSQVTVGLVSGGSIIGLTNKTTVPLTINSFNISSSVFYLGDGIAPVTLSSHQTFNFAVRFAPAAAQAYSGQMTFQISDGTQVVVNLSGTGITTGAVATLNPTSLKFLNQSEGATSKPQTVTITNTGTTDLKVISATTFAPFTVTGLTNTVTLSPGNSLTLSVTYFGGPSPTATGNLSFNYDVLPTNSVTLTGTTAPAKKLAITNFPTLPSATQSAAYLATLQAVKGTGNLKWRVQPGSTLPSGLTLSNTGVISGTLASTVAAGNYTFSVQAQDQSSPVQTAVARLTLNVGAPTGANCNQITWDVAGATTPITPITDLGTNQYLGEEGGLYANGSNARPSGFDAFGVSLADSIQPLAPNGQPDPNGKEVMISLGTSAAGLEFGLFQVEAQSDPTTNPRLVIVDGTQPSETAGVIADPASGFWTSLSDYFLPQSGVTANQVVAAWIEIVDAEPTGTFPSDMTNLQANLESIAQNLLVKYPNIKLAYFSSRIYGGYATNNLDPEPYAYESGFAVKNAIQDQINGDPALNYDPSKGPVVAPWMSWGAYYWANGLNASLDGNTWSCQDLQHDGTHPDNPGRARTASSILAFFRTDDTTAPWFLAPAVQVAAPKRVAKLTAAPK
jgi:hypothetical protein